MSRGKELTSPRRILLSFDIEEFDVPREHGVELPMEEQARISIAGTEAILDILKEHQVKATIFSTANFAQLAPAVITRLLNEGHELASHGYYHWTFETADLKRSKDALETQTGITIRGYRQARMMPVAEQEVQRAGYTYNSSLNPTFIPGRYMHLSAPRTYFMKEGILQIPASVTPILRSFGYRVTTYPLGCIAGSVGARLGMMATLLSTSTHGNFIRWVTIPSSSSPSSFAIIQEKE